MSRCTNVGNRYITHVFFKASHNTCFGVVRYLNDKSVKAPHGIELVTNISLSPSMTVYRIASILRLISQDKE